MTAPLVTAVVQHGSFSLPLPAAYRAREVLAFHARDARQLAERVDGASISKGLLLQGAAVSLDIALKAGQAHCEWHAFGTIAAAETELTEVARRLLGLKIDPAPFEALVRKDPIYADICSARPGLRIAQSATPFEALTWAITGQQINLSFAITLRNALIRLAGTEMADGLWCYPDAIALARLSPEQLGAERYSRAKAETLIRLARLVADGDLPLDDWWQAAPGEMESRLLAIKGIGPWTVNYALMRGYGLADCSLQGDVAVRNALQARLGRVDKLSQTEAQAILQRYAPHRSMAAAYLWASLAASD